MITELNFSVSRTLLKLAYRDTSEKTLEYLDSQGLPWSEKGYFPSAGNRCLLINGIHPPLLFQKLFGVLQCGGHFRNSDFIFYLQEETPAPYKTCDFVCDASSIEDIMTIASNNSHLNSLIFSSSLAWSIKLHHDGFAFISGSDLVCETISNSFVKAFIQPVRWVERPNSPDVKGSE